MTATKKEEKRIKILLASESRLVVPLDKKRNLQIFYIFFRSHFFLSPIHISNKFKSIQWLLSNTPRSHDRKIPKSSLPRFT